MKLTVKRSKGYRKVFVDEIYFANLYRVAKGYGGTRLKEGEWIINRGPGAIDRRLFFPTCSYPTIEAAVAVIEKALQPPPE